MFQVLNGPTYTEDDRPPLWRNEKPLAVPYQEDCLWLDMTHAPLADFPLVEDFQVWLEFSRNEFGYHARFYSAERGFIATFGWWDHIEQDMLQADFKIPLGKFDRPVHLFEESWEIHIALVDDFVYVLEGEWDDDLASNCHSWFKVRHDRYISEWQKAIQACRETFLTNDK
jgi:hypothetical protein